MFDWTISAQTLINAIALLTAGIWAFSSLKGDVKLLQNEQTHIREQLQMLNGSFGQLSEILKQIAVQGIRLAMLEKNIDELKHGQGFVKV